MSQTPLEAAVASESPVAYFAGKEGLGIVSKYGGDSSCAKFHIIRKVEKAPDLPEVQEDIHIENFKPLPKELLARVLAFFRRVAKDHHSEAIVILGWNKKRQKYYIAKPRCATVGPGHLQYKKGDSKKTVGTIHSHGNFSAGFSSTDDEHEKGTAQTAPGIYMVMGNVLYRPEMVSSIAGMGLRKDIKDFIEVGELPVYEMGDREYQYWFSTTQVLSQIEGKKDGYFLLDPKGDILRWAEKWEDLAPYKEEEDRIRKAGKKILKAKFQEVNERFNTANSNFKYYGGDYWRGRHVEWEEGVPFHSGFDEFGCIGEGSAYKDAFDGFFRHDREDQSKIVGIDKARKSWNPRFRWMIDNIGEKPKDIREFIESWIAHLDLCGSAPIAALEAMCDVVGWETVVDVLVANADKLDLPEVIAQLSEETDRSPRDEKVLGVVTALSGEKAKIEGKEVEEEDVDDDPTDEIVISDAQGPPVTLEERCEPRLLDAEESATTSPKE